MDESHAPDPKDKRLFTPGPLTTSRTVKAAMLRDVGSRDPEFLETVRRVREGILGVAGLSREEGWEAVLLQGSGTFGLEAVIGSAMPPGGKLLAVANGAYGARLAAISGRLGIATETATYAEDALPEPAEIERRLEASPEIDAVAVVHCETATGMFNPVAEIGEVAGRFGKTVIVDSMSAFGAVPLDFRRASVDFLVSSANKCIEGVPGFSFIICRRTSLLATEGRSRSLSLDLLAQWKGFEANGQFRFTPPTHAILAFAQALRELEEEGGAAARAARYRKNRDVIARGMRELGFEAYLPEGRQGYIISTFRYPRHPRFRFEEFYTRLSGKGYIIYPGKVSRADCFRIGHIGRLDEADMRDLLRAIRETLDEMGVEPP